MLTACPSRGKAVNVSDLPTDARPAVGVPTPTPQVHVLIADRDETSRSLRETQLRTAGFRVSVARTGFEAIIKATCQVPDAVLLDDSLTDIEAAETGRLITTCPVTSHIPIMRLLRGRRVPRRILMLLRQAAV